MTLPNRKIETELHVKTVAEILKYLITSVSKDCANEPDAKKAKRMEEQCCEKLMKPLSQLLTPEELQVVIADTDEWSVQMDNERFLTKHN